MAVAYDNSATIDDFGVTSKTTGAFTIAGSNRAAFVGLGAFLDTTVESATCGGVSGTKIASTDLFASGLQVMLFSVIAPAAGSQTASCSWTGAASCTVAVVTLSGVNQTTPANGGVNHSTPFATTNSQSVTSTSGDLTITFLEDGNGDGASTSNQTKKTTGQCGSFDIGPGTGTTTHTWSRAAADMVLSGANAAQAGGAVIAIVVPRTYRPFPFKPGSPPSRNAPYR